MPSQITKIDDPEILSLVLTNVRRNGTTTRPKISNETGLSRTLITKHVEMGLNLGILDEGKLAKSTGGRAPRLLQFNKNRGFLLLAELGASGMAIAISDLLGNPQQIFEVSIDISQGAQTVLTEVEKVFDSLLKDGKGNLWGIGIGLPGPVEFATGVPMSPPIMPGWDKYNVRTRFSAKYEVPVWVDNDVNLMALGESTNNSDSKQQELIYIKIGSGVGAGIICRGALHRGAQGCAGDIGHIAIPQATEVICRCGNVGCLEAFSGGFALARDANAAAANGTSKFLKDKLLEMKYLSAMEVIEGANHGDSWCVDAIATAGRNVGEVLATLINFYNPSLVVIGGGISSAGNPLLAAIREAVYRRSLPLATRDLEIRIGEIDNRAGLRGAAEMVLSELFAPEVLGQWVANGVPSLPITY